MGELVALSYSRSYPVDVEHAFTILPIPLEHIFRRRYGPVAPIRGTDQDGAWDEAGKTRRIRMADGGSMRERLTAVEAPHRFAYSLDELRGPLRLLATGVDGEWAFAPAGTGTRVTWRWDVTPTVLGRVGAAALRAAWTGYARHAFDALDELLVRT